MVDNCGAEQHFLTVPWSTMGVGGTEFMMKAIFTANSYHLLLTDTHTYWSEVADEACIRKKMQEQNRKLRAPVSRICDHLKGTLKMITSGDHDTISRGSSEPDDTKSTNPIVLFRQDEQSLHLCLENRLSEMPFHWEFACLPTDPTLVSKHLLRPALVMLVLLCRETQELRLRLAQKDAEIAEYRDNGATLNRKSLQTEVFNGITFNTEFLAKHVERCVQQPAGVLSDPKLQELYQEVMKQVTMETRMKNTECLIADMAPCEPDSVSGESSTFLQNPTLYNHVRDGVPATQPSVCPELIPKAENTSRKHPVRSGASHRSRKKPRGLFQ
uniref:Non-homologous end-joining factor 1 n=1 Tax=Eptatretus burgeri TaxID=7764 RepID=A0A8C4Q8N4_EPTBU